MAFKDSAGVPVQIGDEVRVDDMDGWIIKVIEDFDLATEVYLEHNSRHIIKTVLLNKITKIS